MKLSQDPSQTLKIIIKKSSSKPEEQNAVEKITKTNKANSIKKTKKENPELRKLNHQPIRMPDQFVMFVKFIKGFTNNLNKKYIQEIKESSKEKTLSSGKKISKS